MFIVNLTYKVPLETVDRFLEQHVAYLNEQYQLGNFHAFGRKVPRDGGVILSLVSDKNELLQILAKDPFKMNDLADYELTEFMPSKTCDELAFLMK